MVCIGVPDSGLPTSAKPLSWPPQVKDWFRAWVPREFRARSIFLRELLSKAADDFDPYSANIPYMHTTYLRHLYLPRLDGKNSMVSGTCRLSTSIL
jgi:hypothetical protein